MVRSATIEDVPRIVDMGVRFIETTKYRDFLRVDRDAMAATVCRLLDGAGAVFVCEQGYIVVGMIGVVLHRNLLSDDLQVGELFWWVEPEARGVGIRLLYAAEHWARGVNATSISMIAPTPEVADLYRRLGYREVETGFQKGL